MGGGCDEAATREQHVAGELSFSCWTEQSQTIADFADLSFGVDEFVLTIAQVALVWIFEREIGIAFTVMALVKDLDLWPIDSRQDRGWISNTNLNLHFKALGFASPTNCNQLRKYGTLAQDEALWQDLLDSLKPVLGKYAVENAPRPHDGFRSRGEKFHQPPEIVLARDPPPRTCGMSIWGDQAKRRHFCASSFAARAHFSLHEVFYGLLRFAKPQPLTELFRFGD